MVLLTKQNVTVELLEGICSEDGAPFLLQTSLGVLKFNLTNTINTLGKHRHRGGMLVLRAQKAHLVFASNQDTLLHGTPEELVDYIKKGNYHIEMQSYG